MLGVLFGLIPGPMGLMEPASRETWQPAARNCIDKRSNEAWQQGSPADRAAGYLPEAPNSGFLGQCPVVCAHRLEGLAGMLGMDLALLARYFLQEDPLFRGCCFVPEQSSNGQNPIVLLSSSGSCADLFCLAAREEMEECSDGLDFWDG